ncbi:hypothetical protein yc1106_00544 [Curvularia clavata]|uniref:Uncharacterized protein n=1 Tax=Curvularia clavata TaxID=95742 RepID=A0A9Q9DNM2_CURCL|nr:hypothetical protein yc1106_00544 [Curvularia clavata]
MKPAQLVAFLGAAALGVQPLAARHVQRALADTHSTVVTITSTHLVSEICTDIARCPPYTTEAETSTIYTTETTTICLLSSTPPGYGLPITPTTTLSVPVPIYPTGSDISFSFIPGTSLSEHSSISVSLQTSGLPTKIASSSIYAMPPTVSPQPSSPKSSVVTATSSTSRGYNVSTMTLSGIVSVPGTVTATSTLIATEPSAPVTIPPVSNTNSVGTSYPISASGSSTISASTGYAIPPVISATPSYVSSGLVPSGSSTSQSNSYPGSIIPSSSTGTFNTVSGSVPVYSSTTASVSSYVAFYPSMPSSSGTHSVSTSYPASSPGASFASSSSSEYAVPPVIVVAPTSSAVSLSMWWSSGGYTPSSNYPAMSSQSISPPSSGYAVPFSSSIPPPAAYPSSSTPPPPAYPSSSLTTVPGTYPAVTTGTSGYLSSSLPASFNSTVLDSTILLTSYQTQTSTPYITISSSSGSPGNYTETASFEVPTYIRSSSSAGHTGSGYHTPSISANVSVVAPTPSLIEVPINTGPRMGARGCSLAAISVLVALVYLA